MNNKNLEELKEAYNNVYNSSELNDEVEYLDEMGRTRTTGQNSGTVFKPSDYRSAGSAGGSGSGGRRGTRPSFKPTVSSQPYKSPFAANRDAAFAKARQIKGSPVVGSATKVGGGSLSTGSSGGSARPATPAPSATKVGGGSLSGGGKVAPTAAVKQTGDKTKDMQTWAKANPTLANKPQKTFNPLMQKTFGYQTGYSPSEVKGNMQKTKTLAGAGVLSNSYEWSSKTMKDIYSLYNSVYEAKKVDQDKDGDNDFADVRIARMIASGVPKNVAIAKVKSKPYNEEFELSENEVYDIVSSYLLENNFAETIDDANNIIENMSASWVGEILDQYEASIQEDFQNWIQALLDEGYDLSEYSVEELSEIYYQQD